MLKNVHDQQYSADTPGILDGVESDTRYLLLKKVTEENNLWYTLFHICCIVIAAFAINTSIKIVFLRLVIESNFKDCTSLFSSSVFRFDCLAKLKDMHTNYLESRMH